ncbi:hypothetical protein ACFLTL_01415 [Chloroflexota bacterium]
MEILDEAYAVARCKDCPWYKACVTPMRLSAEDIRRQVEASSPEADVAPAGDLGMQNLLASMASAAQNSLLEGCPVFIERLRSSPRLAQHFKEVMQQWGSGEITPT